MPWRRCRGRRLWRERLAPPYAFQDEFYLSQYWPGDVSGLLVWYRPETLAAYGEGAALTAWEDSSGNGLTASPANPLAPVVKKGLQNGRDAVRFAGTTDVLTFAHTAALAEWTVFMALGGLDVATHAVNYATGQTGAGMTVGGTDPTFGFLGEYRNGAQYLESAVKPTVWGIDCWRRQHLYRDNVEVVYGPSLGTLGNLQFWTVGGRDDIADLGVIGDVGELLIYGADLTAAQQLAVHGYLRDRWATP